MLDVEAELELALPASSGLAAAGAGAVTVAVALAGAVAVGRAVAVAPTGAVAAAMATGAAFLDAHDVVGLVDEHRHAGAVGLDHVHFVLGVAVGVGLHAHDGGVTADLGDRGSLHLGRDVAGDEGLVTALLTPRLAVVSGRAGVARLFGGRGGRCGGRGACRGRRGSGGRVIGRRESRAADRERQHQGCSQQYPLLLEDSFQLVLLCLPSLAWIRP